MLLAYREDPSFFAVAQALGLHTVQRCVERAVAYLPLVALDDQPRPGKESTITTEAKAWFVDLACRALISVCLGGFIGKRNLAGHHGELAKQLLAVTAHVITRQQNHALMLVKTAAWVAFCSKSSAASQPAI